MGDASAGAVLAVAGALDRSYDRSIRVLRRNDFSVALLDQGSLLSKISTSLAVRND